MQSSNQTTVTDTVKTIPTDEFHIAFTMAGAASAILPVPWIIFLK
jgi:hypothetical protein